MAETTAGGGQRLPYLESVRGVAAVGVVLNHLVTTFYPWLLDPASDEVGRAGPVVRLLVLSPASVAIDGRTPVAVFFVLSGFVLTLSQRRSAHDPVLLARASADAAARRYLRLAGPILGAALIPYFLARAHLLPRRPVIPSIRNSWLASPGPTSGVGLFDPADGPIAQGLYAVLLGAPVFTGVLWTMPIELAGSYLVFGFVALFGTARHRWAAYAIVALALVLSQRPYILQFLLGSALCDGYLTAGPRRVAHRGELRWAVWPMLAVAAAFACHGRLDTRGVDRLPFRPYHPTLGAALFVALPLISAPLRRIYGTAPLVWLGRVSFGLYLMHPTVIASVGVVVYLHLRTGAGWGHDGAALAAGAASLALSLPVGWVFFRVVDRPSVIFARWVAAAFLGRPACDTADPPATA